MHLGILLATGIIRKGLNKSFTALALESFDEVGHNGTMLRDTSAHYERAESPFETLLSARGDSQAENSNQDVHALVEDRGTDVSSPKLRRALFCQWKTLVAH